jgi:hypothetical protein
MHECSLDYIKIIGVLTIQIYHENEHCTSLPVPLEYFVGGKIVLLQHVCWLHMPSVKKIHMHAIGRSRWVYLVIDLLAISA